MLGALDGPYIYARALTANDNVASKLTEVSRAIFVGTGGNVAVHFAIPQPNSATNSTPVFANATFVNVANGALLQIRIDQIYSTGTTANNFLALY